MAFPSILDSFSYPTATSRLNSPSHSALENSQSSVISQLENVIGLDYSASVLGTIIGDLRSPGSGGGGHVQSANKGGTGQTIFNKGDILVASSSSVLSKLSAGTNGQAIVADSSQSSGLKYSNVVSNRITVTTSVASYSGGVASIANVLFASSILGSVIGTNNAVQFKGTIDTFSLGANNNFVLNLQYGNQSVASINMTATAGSIVGFHGILEGMLLGNGSATDQKGWMRINIGNDGFTGNGLIQPLGYTYILGASSVNSSANQDLIITTQMTNGSNSQSILGTIFVVEKIA